jgi:hypothetical protein
MVPLEEVQRLAGLYARGGIAAVSRAHGICAKSAWERLARAGVARGRGGRQPSARLSLAVDLLAIYRDAGVPLSLSTAARWCGRPTTQVAFVLATRYGIGRKRNARKVRG